MSSIDLELAKRRTHICLSIFLPYLWSRILNFSKLFLTFYYVTQDSDGRTRIECLPQHIKDFSLLSRTSFVLTSTLNSGALLIYSFPPSPSTTHTQKPKLVASLHLPPIRPTYRVQRIGIHSAPYHAHAPKDASFYTSPDAGVQVVTITYAMDETNSPGSSSFSLFVHTRTLLGYTHGRQDSETEGDGNGQALALTRMSEREDVDIQWHQWGETKTRFFPIRTPIHWHRYVL